MNFFYWLLNFNNNSVFFLYLQMLVHFEFWGIFGKCSFDVENKISE